MGSPEGKQGVSLGREKQRELTERALRKVQVLISEGAFPDLSVSDSLEPLLEGLDDPVPYNLFAIRFYYNPGDARKTWTLNIEPKQLVDEEYMKTGLEQVIRNKYQELSRNG